jgi:hypothetical protein
MNAIAAATMYWFIAFSGELGTTPADMRPGMAAGPFTLKQCYLLGAGLLERLKIGFVGESFRGVCWTEEIVERRPGMELLDTSELRNRAWALP